MLKALRKKGSVKAIMWILAIIIVPAFVLWGAGSMIRDRAQGYAGKIFNKVISLEDYLRSWEASRDQALMIYGRLFEQIAPYLDLDNQAWDRLILLEETRKQRIKVADDELIQRIRDFPMFQKDGAFDPKIYDWILKYYFRTTPIKFEEEMRQSIKISKLVEKIYNQINLTEAQLKDEFVKANEKAKFSYLLVEAESFLSQVAAIEEKELLDYYAKNQESFRRPESIKVEYISLNSSDFETQTQVSEEEIQGYFTAHSEEFKPQEPSPEPAASPVSETTTHETSPTDKNPQDNKEPLPALTPEIKTQINSRLVAQKARDKVEEIKNELVSQLNPQAKLEEFAQKYGLSFKETDYFSLDQPLPEIGFNLAFYNTAFNLDVGEISQPIESYGGYIFLKVRDKKTSYVPEFSEVKVKVEESLRKEKARDLAKEKAQVILQKLKETSFEDTAKEFGLSLVSTDLINREGYISGIGKSEEFIRVGFSLNPAETAPQLIQTERGFVLLRLDEKQAINDEDFQKEKDIFKERLLAQKQAEHFQEWFENLKKKANLVSNIDKLKSRLSP
jgi:peptidyl-prolyl cis-trans isomerase D